MKQEVLINQTDYTVLVYIPDSASTDGSGKTGLVAANLTVSGVRVETDNDVTVIDYTASLNNLAALTTAHTDWGLLEVSSALAPGLYRLDIADAIFATGAWSAVVYVMVTTSAAAASPMEFVLVPQQPYVGVNVSTWNSLATVALPLIPTVAGRTLDVSAGGEAGVDWANVGTQGTTVALTATTIATTQKVDVETIKTNAVVNAGTVTFPTTATLASTTNITAGTITTVTNLTNAPTAGDLTAAMKTSVEAAVWDATISSHVTAGTFGEAFASIRSNTATAVSSTTLTLDASASAVDDFYNDCILYITGGTGVGQARWIQDYTGSSKQCTISPAWITTPAATCTFSVLLDTRKDVGGVAGTVQSVPGAAGGIMLTGATNAGNTVFSGTTAYTGNVSYADGVTVAAPSTLNRSGISITGNGTGNGFYAYGGTGTGSGIAGAAAAGGGHGITGTGSATGSHGLVGYTSGANGDGFNLTGGSGGFSLNDGIINALRVKKNTALTAFPFRMVLTSDHVTEATGKTITATRSLDGGAFAACANAATEVGVGTYVINLAATDTNANTISLRFTATLCDVTPVIVITSP